MRSLGLITKNLSYSLACNTIFPISSSPSLSLIVSLATVSTHRLFKLVSIV